MAEAITILCSILLIVILIGRAISQRKKKYHRAKTNTRTDSRSQYKEMKGTYGEMVVQEKLMKLPSEYVVFNNVYLNIEGESVQIDHVVVSRYGVFVIETKNYSGKIYGMDHSEKWTEYFSNGTQYEFNNPIKQNYHHTAAIRRLLGISQASTIPVVVFLHKADIRCETESAVLYVNQLTGFICRHKDVQFTDDGVERLCEKMTISLNLNANRKDMHVRSVREKMKERENKIDNHICPQCGGKLVERTGKYGTFWGCYNYPKCKFTTKK